MEKPNIRYLSILECSDFHQVEVSILETFIDYGVIEVEVRDDNTYLAETELDLLESAIRLHRDLRVNPEGIDIILEMRKEMQRLQNRIHDMEIRLRQYE